MQVSSIYVFTLTVLKEVCIRGCSICRVYGIDTTTSAWIYMGSRVTAQAKKMLDNER
jgi:hypothetical protein